MFHLHAVRLIAGLFQRKFYRPFRFYAPLLLALGMLAGTYRAGAADYYWVGGTGVWNDLNHWATTSGGAVKHTIVPSALDNVLFDASSFSGAGQSVTLNQEAFCKDFKWDNVANNPTFTGAGFNLNVAGNYIALGTPFTFNHVNGNLPISGYFLVDGSNMSFTKNGGTMTVGGQFAGKHESMVISASTPPVEEPIASSLPPGR